MQSNLQKNLLDYVHGHQLFMASDFLLVGVSGGVDSVVLAHLLGKSGSRIAIAHVDFQLRGSESDEDAIFVEAFAKKINVPFYKYGEDTEAFAKINKISIQEAAREIRYDWFEKNRVEVGAKWIAVAHHKNDIAETVLFNLTRGTGIAGLHGMRPKNGNIIRPLLFAERSEIIAYAKKYDLTWREDSSNASTKYARNLIRHEVLPKLENINPKVVEHIHKTSLLINDIELIVDSYLESMNNQFVTDEAGTIRIDLAAIKKMETANTILYYLLKKYDFNAAHIQSILDSKESSKVFLSKSKRAVIHGESLLVTDFAEGIAQEYQLEDWATEPIQAEGLTMSWKLADYYGQKIADEEDEVWLDVDKLVFPLILRKRKAGDKFQPLGMKGRAKKLKDFLTDRKLSLPEKEKIWLLVSGDGKVAWVVGKRIDERFKIYVGTKKIIKLKILPQNNS